MTSGKGGYGGRGSVEERTGNEMKEELDGTEGESERCNSRTEKKVELNKKTKESLKLESERQERSVRIKEWRRR